MKSTIPGACLPAGLLEILKKRLIMYKPANREFNLEFEVISDLPRID